MVPNKKMPAPIPRRKILKRLSVTWFERDEMNKSKIFISLLAILLIISIILNGFLASQSFATTSDQTKIDMSSILGKAQVNLDNEMQRIGFSLVYASEQLSTTGISGDQAHVVLSALVANSSYIVGASTQDLDMKMLAVEPEALRSSEGKTVSSHVSANTNPDAPITPVMSSLIPLSSIRNGTSMVAPVFDQNKELIGRVSVILDPTIILNGTTAQLLEGKSYEFIAMQTDGQTLWDSNPAKKPTNLFTNPAFANQTELLALTHNIADEYSGYGTYNSDTANQSKPHEVYWTTITIYGVEWRLALIHKLYS